MSRPDSVAHAASPAPLDAALRRNAQENAESIAFHHEQERDIPARTAPLDAQEGPMNRRGKMDFSLTSLEVMICWSVGVACGLLLAAMVKP